MDHWKRYEVHYQVFYVPITLTLPLTTSSHLSPFYSVVRNRHSWKCLCPPQYKVFRLWTLKSEGHFARNKLLMMVHFLETSWTFFHDRITSLKVVMKKKRKMTRITLLSIAFLSSAPIFVNLLSFLTWLLINGCIYITFWF